MSELLTREIWRIMGDPGHNTQERVIEALRALRAIGHTWQQIADQDDYKGVPRGTLWAIARGDPIPQRHRAKLGLPPLGERVIEVVDFIPEGTQVLMARRCACGAWFVANTVRRKKCFICSPYRGKANGRGARVESSEVQS